MHLSKILIPLARRFIAGETAQEGLDAVRAMNARGVLGILDFLGEDVRSETDAAAAAGEYERLLTLLHDERVNSVVSLKVSQMGLLRSQDFCLQNLTRVVQQAQRLENFVWIDMEGSALTQKTIDVFQHVRRQSDSIGLCLQAYLTRTSADVDLLMREPAGKPLTLRLCKGAYKEPPEIAFPTKSAVDWNYRALAQKILERASSGVYPAFATHDPALIDFVIQTAAEKHIPSHQFEFQMLYGIRTRLLESLARRGFRTRVYIPYGTAWLPYFSRRLRERKENVYFLLKNMFRM